MPRNPLDKKNDTWENCIGTLNLYNLPEYKVHDNLCGINIDNITHPGVTINSFRVFHKKCPYSIQSNVHKVRNLNVLDPNYFKMEELDPAVFTDHSDTNGVMIRESRGSIHGNLCVDNNCYYYLNNNNRYFHR